MHSTPSVGGCAGLPRTRTAQPLSTVVTRLQVSGQSCGQAPMTSRTDVVALGRFVDGIVVAIERGTPLADVLRAQAQDVRDHDKRVLMEIAGKKEIAMLVPVVFFILPLSVMFAVFPGLAVLDLGF